MAENYICVSTLLDVEPKHFAKFYEKYGFKGAFAGMRHHWESREEFWGYLATFLNTTLHAEIRQPYKDLQEILKDKD